MDALPAEASCPICLEFFRDPVSIHCGHHFCRACIERCWEWPTDRFACPRCRDTAPQRSLRPSPELARVLEIARRLSRGEALGGEEEEEEEGEEGCRRHREPLEVFCRQDGALLCAICRESRAHRAHTVLPLPEAAREFKEQIQAGLQTLKDDRDKLLEFREAEMRRNWEFLEKTETERQRILSHFQGLRLALEELSRHLLARLGRLEGDIATVQDENVTGLTQEISRLDARVRELEEKCEQPARTFLQDISGTLSSLGKEKLQLPPSPLPELEKKIHRFREENILLEETLRSFQDALVFELPEKMTVTLDPSTAHPQLLVAPDGSSVSWESARDPPGTGAEPAVGAGPGTDPSVLGREGVTAGRRCWDVRVTPEGSWALGVATETPGSGGETPGIRDETPGIPGIGDETPGIGDETPENGAGTPGIGAETPEIPGIGAETPGIGAGIPGIGAETPGIPGIGAETPENGAGTPGIGAETPGIAGIGAETPGIGDEIPRIPGIGAETPENGAGTPWIGDETPEIPGIGTEIPRIGAEIPGIGAETPKNGAGTPGIGTGTPGRGTWIPGIGAETPRIPGIGTEIPGIEAETPGIGAETPENGAGTPGIGDETPGIPGIGTETPENGVGTPRIGTGTPGIGTGTPGIGAGTPGMGTGTPGNGAGTPGSAEWDLWSMGLCQGQFWALTSLERIPLFPVRAPGRVRVALDYERGQVAFFDADQRSLIFAFPAASFKGRSVRPWFLVWGEGSRLTLCP